MLIKTGQCLVINHAIRKSNLFFLIIGRRFSARLRHANLKYPDDASSDVRSFALKFSDSDSDSPLDIIMNTGEANVFWNSPSFEDFVASNRSEDALQDFVYKNPY